MSTFLNITRSLAVLAIFLPISLFSQEKEIAAGKTAMESGDLTRAIEMFRKATREDKKSIEAHTLLAEALLKADSLDALSTVIVLAKDLDPNNAKLYIIQGDGRMKQKLPVPAISEYTKATELDPKNLDAWLKLAEAQKKARQYNEVAKTYQTVLTLDSMNVTALRELASVYFRGKQYANAAVYLEILARLQPDSLNIQLMYVKALSESKRCKDVIPVAQAILKKDASLTDVEAMLAQAYDCTGQTDSLLIIYDKQNADSMSVDQLIRYGKILKTKNRLDNAEDIFKRAYQKEPARCDIPYDLGTVYMSLKKYRDAVSMFEKKIACDTSAGYQYASHLNAAMSLMQIKELKEARDHTKKAIDVRPTDVKAWQTLAQCYAIMEQVSDAITTYKKVIDLATEVNTNGDEGKYNSALREAYYYVGVQILRDAIPEKDADKRKQKYTTAIDYLGKALQYDSKDCDILYYLGVSNQNINNKEKAKSYYNKFLDFCPKDKRVEEVKKHLKSLGD